MQDCQHYDEVREGSVHFFPELMPVFSARGHKDALPHRPITVIAMYRINA
jgi:hypothetical protein